MTSKRSVKCMSFHQFNIAVPGKFRRSYWRQNPGQLLSHAHPREMLLCRRLLIVKKCTVRSAPLTLTKFESLKFNPKREKSSSETSQKDVVKLLEEWSNRTSEYKECKPLVSLQQVVQGAKGSDKFLYHHGYQHLFQCVSRDVGTAPIHDVANALCTCLQQGPRREDVVVNGCGIGKKEP